MKLLDLLAEAISQEKQDALKAKFVVGADEKGFAPNKMTQKEFDQILKIDDSPNGKYLNWLLPRYAKLDRTERARFFKDGHNEEVKNGLEWFEKNARRAKKVIADFKNDINQYKELRDFENEIGAARAKIEGGEEEVQVGPEKLRGAYIAPIKVLGNTPSGFTVYRVPQECKGDEACYKKYLDLTGCGDQSQNFTPDKEGDNVPASGYRVAWCTRNTGMFNNYLTNGPYYLFKNWKTRRQYQLHYESGQLKDEADREINGYNSKLQNEFLQFLLDKEGRIPTKSMSFNLDLDRFKEGDADGFPIYKIGPLYYIDARTGEDQKNNLVYFDSETSQIKNVDGTSASTKNALRSPYDKLIMYLYQNNLFTPEKGSKAYQDWMGIRIFGNIDIPPTAKPTVNGNVNLSGTNITSLPNNLTIGGDFDLSKTKLNELPDNLTVKGVLNLKGTGLQPKSDTRASKIIAD
jgi:hypothetical protein